MSAFSPSSVRDRYWPLFPGILLALTVATAARFVADHYGAPVMLFALLIGMAFNFEWANESLFYGLYDRTDSFWENSQTLQATGMPYEVRIADLLAHEAASASTGRWARPK